MQTYIAIGAVLALLMVLYVVVRAIYKLSRHGEEPVEFWLVGLVFAVFFVVLLWPVAATLFLVKDRE